MFVWLLLLLYHYTAVTSLIVYKLYKLLCIAYTAGTHTHTHTHTKIRQSHNPQTGERSGHQLTATRGESHFGEAATHRHMLKITVS